MGSAGREEGDEKSDGPSRWTRGSRPGLRFGGRGGQKERGEGENWNARERATFGTVRFQPPFWGLYWDCIETGRLSGQPPECLEIWGGDFDVTWKVNLFSSGDTVFQERVNHPTLYSTTKAEEYHLLSRLCTDCNPL
jgi:hypothetical protein